MDFRSFYVSVHFYLFTRSFIHSFIHSFILQYFYSISSPSIHPFIHPSLHSLSNKQPMALSITLLFLCEHRVRSHRHSIMQPTSLQNQLRIISTIRDIIDRHHQRELLIHLHSTRSSSPTCVLISISYTSLHVVVPCSFCPFSISASSCSQLFPVRANASAQRTLRPPQHVVIRSATPADWKNVLSCASPTLSASHLHALIKHLRKLLHFLQPDANQRRFRVRSVAQRVHEPRAQRDHVLQRTAELHAHRVVHQLHAEVRSVEQHLQLLGVVANAITMSKIGTFFTPRWLRRIRQQRFGWRRWRRR